MKLITSFIAAIFLLSAGYCQTITDKGSIWLGGGFNFTNVGEDSDDRTNILGIAPTFRFFPFHKFFIGPRFNLIRTADENNSITMAGLGGDVGFAYVNSGNGRVFYLRSGAQTDLLLSSYDYGSNNGSDTQNGFTIPVALGFIIPLKDIIAFQFEPGYQFKSGDDNSVNAFSLSIGIAGMSNTVILSWVSNLINYYL